MQNNKEMLKTIMKMNSCAEKVAFLSEIPDGDLKSLFVLYKNGTTIDSETTKCILVQIGFRFCRKEGEV